MVIILFLNDIYVILQAGGEHVDTTRFEIAFGEFLDSQEYDRAEDALFSLVRAAFRAGYLAAQQKTAPQTETPGG